MTTPTPSDSVAAAADPTIAITDRLFPTLSVDTLNYIGSEISHDIRESESRLDRIRWNNRAMGMAVCTINRMKQQHADLARQLAEAREEARKDREFANVVLSSLRWTGDGYDWTGGQYDYRLEPSQGVAYTLNTINDLRAKVKERDEQLAKFNDATPLTPEIVRKVLGEPDWNHKCYEAWRLNNHLILRVSREYDTELCGNDWMMLAVIETTGALRHLIAGLGIEGGA